MNPKRQPGQGKGPRELAGALLDVRGVAELLGVTEKAIRCRAAQRLLPCRRWGGRVVFLRSEIEAFFAALPGVSIEEARQEQATRRAER
jgi:predicted DNA-binding transcriptional regulator AlpA